MDTMRSAKSSPTSSSAISAQYRLWRAGYLIGVYAAVRREPDGGVWAAVRPSVASSTAPRRGSDVLLTTLDHPGAGVARDGGGEQREYAYYVFQDSCMRAICKEPKSKAWNPEAKIRPREVIKIQCKTPESKVVVSGIQSNTEIQNPEGYL